MEEFLRRELGTTKLHRIGAASGFISSGNSYETDSGKVFVKFNGDSEVIRLVLIK